jgi:predicted SAM-dependent methyltransferase
VNIDLLEPCELQLDLREDMPFKDEVAAMVYAEHFLEHLLHPIDSMHFLRECLRVLKPGGVIRIVVPDSEWPLRAYVSNDDEYFRMAREKWHVRSDCRTRLDHVNLHFREGGHHLYAYDYETLADVLSTAGFTDIGKDEYDPGLDTAERRVGSLYVVARRPDCTP